MIRRRAARTDISTKAGNHTFRATGITTFLANGGSLENAQAMANHASTRTTHIGATMNLLSMKSSGLC
jgi:site-specific recombinase XerD